MEEPSWAVKGFPAGSCEEDTPVEGPRAAQPAKSLTPVTSPQGTSFPLVRVPVSSTTCGRGANPRP